MLDLIVVNNCIFDVVYDTVHDSVLEALELLKGAYNHEIKIEVIEDYFADLSPKFQSPAGSPGNVAFSASRLGINTAITGTIGNDERAKKFMKMMQQYGVENLTRSVKGRTDTCYTFITPDGERTFAMNTSTCRRYNLPKGGHKAKIVHTSCYELAEAPEKIINYLRACRKKGAKISLDLADPGMIRSLGRTLDNVLEITDILFASQEEYEAAFSHQFRGYHQIPGNHDIVVMKYGMDGTHVMKFHEGKLEQTNIPVYKVDVKNTNGAGDTYTAGFLSGYLQGLSLEECGHLGSKKAAEVAGMVGACLP